MLVLNVVAKIVYLIIVTLCKFIKDSFSLFVQLLDVSFRSLFGTEEVHALLDCLSPSLKDVVLRDVLACHSFDVEQVEDEIVFALSPRLLAFFFEAAKRTRLNFHHLHSESFVDLVHILGSDCLRFHAGLTLLDIYPPVLACLYGPARQ